MSRVSLAHASLLATITFAVFACTDESTPGRPASPAAIIGAAAPPDAAPGTCWDKTVEPAVIETVTEQALLRPAELNSDGTVQQPAVFETQTRQAIIRERKETWFETVCPNQLTPEFVSSLQRALKARGYFSGPITAQYTSGTKTAVRRYQADQGIPKGTLTLNAARLLGLAAIAS